jgi:hypothetical protein
MTRRRPLQIARIAPGHAALPIEGEEVQPAIIEKSADGPVAAQDI